MDECRSPSGVGGFEDVIQNLTDRPVPERSRGGETKNFPNEEPDLVHLYTLFALLLHRS